MAGIELCQHGVIAQAGAQALDIGERLPCPIRFGMPGKQHQKIDVGNGHALADQPLPPGQPLVDNGEVAVEFGNGNWVAISRYLAQVTEPSQITGFGIDLARFKVFAIKSRVHFRRGFDDSGFARTILLVEPVEPFLGTVRLDGLPYENVDLKRFYPCADLTFP